MGGGSDFVDIERAFSHGESRDSVWIDSRCGL